MLSIKNISYQVNQLQILQNISVDFEPGKLHLIVGPNGAGKSTLLKVMSDALYIQTDSVLYNQTNINEIPLNTLAKIRAVLSQNIDLAFPLSVAEVVMMGRYPHFNFQPDSADELICQDAMKFFDVYNFSNQLYLNLSGGEKQRVQLARVLSQVWDNNSTETKYIFLDEPLSSLDEYYQFQLMQQLTRLVKEKNIVIIAVVHDLNIASRYGDQIILMHQGKLMAAGNSIDVLTETNIELAYHLKPIFFKQGNYNYIFFRI